MSKIPGATNSLKTKRESSKVTRTDATPKSTKYSTNSQTKTSSSTTKETSRSTKATDERDKLKAKISNVASTKTVAPKSKTQVAVPLRSSTTKNEEVKRKTTQISAAAASNSKTATSTAARTTSTAARTTTTAARTTSTAARTTTTAARTISSSVATKQQPLRAKHPSDAAKKSQQISSVTVQNNSPRPKPNAVLDTPHNVTVASPPSKRKEFSSDIKESEQENSLPESKTTTRKGSRTLAPEEIVVLRRESAKKRMEEEIRRGSVHQQDVNEAALSTPLKQAIAFEVGFEKAEQNKRERSRSRVRPVENSTEDDANYSDDFESYESDFESSNNSEETSEHSSDDEGTSEGSEDQASSTEASADSDSKSDHHNDDDDDEEEESDITQNPITVIQREKERKLDSGNYDMNSRKPKLADLSSQSTQQLMDDSLDAFSMANSEQLDSGISTYAPASSNNFGNVMETIYGGYKEFNTRPILNKRGSDLMSKIQFDVLSFTLLDMKPISYDVFMQSYGKLNTTQSSTQTQENRMATEQQTDCYDTRSIWTQHPAQYDLQMVNEFLKEDSFYRGLSSNNCCGEFEEEELNRIGHDSEYDKSLSALKALSCLKSQKKTENHIITHRKPIDFEKLNTFLQSASRVLTQIISSSEAAKEQAHVTPRQDKLSLISERYYNLNSNFLNCLRVVKIFANPKFNLLISVHETLPDSNVYSSDFSNLLMIWSSSDLQQPLRLLSTWSEVAKVDICYDSADIVVAALRDGSIAMWDLRETHSFCSKLDGYLTHFAATQSIVAATMGQSNSKQKKSAFALDLGSCLEVRSFPSSYMQIGLQSLSKRFNKSQFISLHDSGMLTVWSLVECSEVAKSLSERTAAPALSSSENLSPWARVKLIQSSIVNLREYLESNSLQQKSRFDKTKTLFQNNIYSDEALREVLHDNAAGTLDSGSLGLRFSGLECNSEHIYVATNRNFILVCSKTLKPERFRKIAINESKFLFPTALKLLSNDQFLAVGLSNGAVMIVNCKQPKPQQQLDQRNINSAKAPETEKSSARASTSDSLDYDPLSGKSCAIQNILLNSQKSMEIDYDHSMPMMHDDDDDGEEYRPTTAACIALVAMPFELRVYDQQIIMSGTGLRQNLIQSLAISSDGWRLFALGNGELRIYDFLLDMEIEQRERVEMTKGKIKDLATTKSSNNELNLFILKDDSQVELHILRK